MKDFINRTGVFRLPVICILLTLYTDTSAQGFWLESNLNYSSRKNDFYIKQLENYNIVEAGIQTGVTPVYINTFGALQFYIKGALNYDISNERWNYADWHNNFVFGLGARLRFSLYGFLPLNLEESSIEIFAEKNWISYLPNELFYTGHRPPDDIQSGLRYGLVSDKFNIVRLSPDPREQFYFWFNSFGGLYYAKNTFYNISQTGFYLLSISSKVGFGINYLSPLPLEFYFIEHLNLDLGKNEWNKLQWNNRTRFGGGIQFKYLRFSFYRPNEINLEIAPYLEYLFIKYNKKVLYIPGYSPSHDIQGGITLRLSFNQGIE